MRIFFRVLWVAFIAVIIGIVFVGLVLSRSTRFITRVAVFGYLGPHTCFNSAHIAVIDRRYVFFAPYTASPKGRSSTTAVTSCADGDYRLLFDRSFIPACKTSLGWGSRCKSKEYEAIMYKLMNNQQLPRFGLDETHTVTWKDYEP